MNRANLLVVDEFRLVNKQIYDAVLHKFLTLKRMPPYKKLSRKERQAEWDKETNSTIFMSSAYYTGTWAYQKCLDTFNIMVHGKAKQFIGAFPYTLALADGLLSRSFVSEEMLESDFSEPKFKMEMEAEFYGNTGEDSFFNFNDVSKNRRIKYPMLPPEMMSLCGDCSDLRITSKVSDEIRILSCDVALMASKRHANDASSIFINRMLPTKSGRYLNNIVYSDVYEGLRTEDLALKIRKMFEDYQCDYIVLDSQGVGMGVFDCLSKDMVDSVNGDEYPALSCCNDDTMAMRCTSRDAPKVIWSIKASAQFNSDIALMLREGFQSGRVRLLLNEYEAETALRAAVRGYDKLSAENRAKLMMPYIQTTLLVDELIKLKHELVGNKVKVKEQSSMRKDRYSGLAYNYYVATIIAEQRMKRKHLSGSGDRIFAIRAPKKYREGMVFSSDR